jgi:hypothetical protein
MQGSSDWWWRESDVASRDRWCHDVLSQLTTMTQHTRDPPQKKIDHHIKKKRQKKCKNFPVGTIQPAILLGTITSPLNCSIGVNTAFKRLIVKPPSSMQHCN